MPISGIAGLGGGPISVMSPFSGGIIYSVETPTITGPNGDVLENPITITSSAFVSEGGVT